MYLQSLDFAPLFKNVFDMNTFVLIFWKSEFISAND